MKLRVPATLVFSVLVSCGDGGPQPGSDGGPTVADAATSLADARPGVADAHSSLFCFPDGTPLDAGCPLYANDHDLCPPGCAPVS